MSGHAAADAFAADLATIIFVGLVLFIAVSATRALYRRKSVSSPAAPRSTTRASGSGHPSSPTPRRPLTAEQRERIRDEYLALRRPRARTHRGRRS